MNQNLINHVKLRNTSYDNKLEPKTRKYTSIPKILIKKSLQMV